MCTNRRNCSICYRPVTEITCITDACYEVSRNCVFRIFFVLLAVYQDKRKNDSIFQNTRSPEAVSRQGPMLPFEQSYVADASSQNPTNKTVQRRSPTSDRSNRKFIGFEA
jgi:hypothetical protein